MVSPQLFGAINGLVTFVDSQSVFDSSIEDNSNSMTTSTTILAPTVNATTNSSTLSLSYNGTIPEGVQEVLFHDNLTSNQLDLLVNVTQEYPITYARVVFGYLMPFVLLITFVTNSLVIVVLWKPHMRSPTNIVLLMMAIVDLGTLIGPSPWYFYIYAIGIDDMYLHPTWKCYAHHIMTDVIPILFHTASIWLALLLASQRYIYVCHPTLALTWCTSPRVTKAIWVIMVTSFLHQLPKFFDNTFISVAIVHNGKLKLACKNQIADWVQLVNLQGYYTTYFIFRILFVFIVPIILLLTLNCFLFQALDEAEDKHKELLGPKYRIVGSGGVNAAHLNNTITEQCSTVDIDNTSNQNNNERKSSKVRAIYRSLSNIASQSKNKIRKQLSKHSTNSAQLKLASTKPNTSASHQVDMSNLVEERNSEKKNKSSSSSSTSSASSSDGSCSSSPCQIQSHAKELVLFQQELPPQASEVKESSCDGQTNIRDGLINSNNQSQEESGRDDSHDLNCSECNATYVRDQQPYCRRCCRAMANEGATSNGGGQCVMSRVARLSKQNTSLCSSMGGYGTTTNDDSTSAAQHVSATIYTGAELGTLEAIGMIMKDHDNDEAKSANMKSIKNYDQAIACECKIKTQQRQGHCYKCGSHNEVKDSNGETKWAPEKACSSSEPSLNGDQGAHNGRYTHGGQMEKNCSKQPRLSRLVSTRFRIKRLTGCLSNQSQELKSKKDQKSKQKKRLSNGATTTTTTTTTTTLYSPINTTTTGSGTILAMSSTRAKQQQQGPPEGGPVNQSRDNTVGQVVEPIAAIQSSSKVSAKTSHRNSGGRRAFRWFSSRGSVAQETGATTTIHMKYLDSQKTTAMLVVVVSVFLAVEVPVGLMTILHVISNTFDVLSDVDFGTPLKYIKLVTNFAIMISYTLNFTIYCSMSKKFRETFRELFNRWGRGGAQSGVDLERRFNDNYQRRITGHHQRQFSSSQVDTHHLVASNNLHQSASESTSGNHLLTSTRSAANFASRLRPMFNRQMANTLTRQQEQECEL